MEDDTIFGVVIVTAVLFLVVYLTVVTTEATVSRKISTNTVFTVIENETSHTCQIINVDNRLTLECLREK